LKIGGYDLGILRKARKKKIKNEIIGKAVATKEIFTDENRKSKIMIMMSLSNLCKSYRNYFKIPKITDENLENGDTKIEKNNRGSNALVYFWTWRYCPKELQSFDKTD